MFLRSKLTQPLQLSSIKYRLSVQCSPQLSNGLPTVSMSSDRQRPTFWLTLHISKVCILPIACEGKTFSYSEVKISLSNALPINGSDQKVTSFADFAEYHRKSNKDFSVWYRRKYAAKLHSVCCNLLKITKIVKYGFKKGNLNLLKHSYWNPFWAQFEVKTH